MRKGEKVNIILAAVNAKYIHSNLAVYCLRASTNEYKEHVKISEYTINHLVDDILMDLYKQKPEVLAFSCYIWNIEIIKELAVEIKKVLPNVKIWAGGPEVSYSAREFLEENKAFDLVMIGEGEKTFAQLVKENVDGTLTRDKLSMVKGIAYRLGTKVCVNPLREIMDLSEVPFPYKDMKDFEHKIVYYETSRGCPFSCSYCLSSIDKTVRLRNMDLVKEEIGFFLEQKVPQVKFIDRTFNCNHKHAMVIWNFIKEHDNGITNFHFEISADLLNEEELELLNSMRVGLVQLEIGVQSTNPKTIDGIHRSMNLDKLSYAVRRVHEGKNIHQHLDLIAGLPHEDYASFRNSFNDVYAMEPEQLQLGFLKVLRGSRMHEEQKKFGVRYKEKAPYEVLETTWLSFEDVLQLKKVEDMVEVYYNSTQFSHSLKFLMHFFDTPFDFYKALGDYYEKENFSGFHHTRIARYQILLSFIRETKPEIVEPLQEILVYDLYLRENMKSRPDFARNLEEYKDAYYQYCKKIQEENKQETPSEFSHYKGYQARQLSRMLHMESFSYDIEEMQTNGTIKKTDTHVVFDYQRRHPLTLEAKVFPITTEVEEYLKNPVPLMHK